MRTLNVLIACEESGTVRDAFRERGHNAWSCDLQPCDPNSLYPEFHIQGDAVSVAREPWRYPQIPTVHPLDPWWDLVIAHPPCTYLCNSGVTWLFKDPSNSVWLDRPFKTYDRKGKPETIIQRRYANVARYWNLRAAAEFFQQFRMLPYVKHVAIENPIMHGYARELIGCGKADQVIQPWMFGHPESKATCLWLKGLPHLVPTDDVKIEMQLLPKCEQQRLHFLGPSKDRAKLRSRTFKGIALAMAEQWGDYVGTSTI
jgi:hypothetical protein